MKYTNKQIKRILRIQEFIDLSDTLARAYRDLNNKDFIIKTFADQERIYKLYCSSVFNLIKAIQASKEFFEHNDKYTDFTKMLETKYTANNNRYYINGNYETTFYKILETIRNQVNHFEKDDDDNNVLFEVYIDFELVEIVHTTIRSIFYEVYNKIDKKKIKDIILSKPKIQYSFDKITNKMDDLKLKINESDNRLNRVFKKDNERAHELYDQLFNSSNLYDLLTNDPKAIEKFDSADKEIKESMNKAEKYINKHGTPLEKEAFQLLKEFTKEKETDSIKNTEKNILEFQEKLNKLKEKYNN